MPMKETTCNQKIAEKYLYEDNGTFMNLTQSEQTTLTRELFFSH